jgi:CBS domain containing-hemolysin-like protein
VIDPQPYILSAFLIFLLDLVLMAAKTGLNNARFPRLLTFRERMNSRVEKTLSLLNHPFQLRAKLHLSQAVFRVLFLGCVVLVLMPWEQRETPVLLFFLMLLAAGILLAVAEHFVGVYVLRDPEMWSLRLTPVARALFLLLTPLLVVPTLLTRPSEVEPFEYSNVTEDELKKLVDAGQEVGVIEQDEGRMIYSVLKFHDTFAREIMVPRIDILALEVNTTIEEATEKMLKSGFSRVPVYEDTIDKVIGILYVKDLLRLYHSGDHSRTLHNKSRPAYFVPETKRVDELLTEMQNLHIHIAMVVDEYGGVAGLVTLEDIVEELVGEIQDEYDQAEEEVYQQIRDGEYLFQGRIDIDDFNEIMHSAFSKDEADTLGGLIFSRIGRVPKGGETIQANDIVLTVEQVTGRRIRKVKARRVSPLPESREERS